MALLAQECLNWIPKSMGDGATAEGKTTLNQAGQHLVDMHRWRWLGREGTVSTVADTDYALLPSDFKSLQYTDETASYGGFAPTTIQRLVARKSSGVTSKPYTGTVVTRVLSSVPTEVLRLDPTPTTTTADVFNIAYIAGWTEIADDRDTVILFPWLRNLYRELVIAFARGYDEDDEVRAAPAGQLIEEHLAVIEQGAVFRAAKKRDGLANPSVGPLTNGWIQMGNQRYLSNAGNSYLDSIPVSPGS